MCRETIGVLFDRKSLFIDFTLWRFNVPTSRTSPDRGHGTYPLLNHPHKSDYLLSYHRSNFW